jgi:hypothetical protein
VDSLQQSVNAFSFKHKLESTNDANAWCSNLLAHGNIARSNSWAEADPILKQRRVVEAESVNPLQIDPLQELRRVGVGLRQPTSGGLHHVLRPGIACER